MKTKEQRNVLMIAFHYPPYQGSSGTQRTLCFSKYLPEYGWQPIILTAHPRAYPQVSVDQLSDVPSEVPVERAFALDTAKAFSVNGHYCGWLALPDRWVTWLLGAIPRGLMLIRKYNPKILWSTYPIATAHLIGFILHRLTGIPWVADFRDPMVEVDPMTGQKWPKNRIMRQTWRWIESVTIKNCARAVFVTAGARRIYVERYPGVSDGRCLLIPNGYDEEAFWEAEQIASAKVASGYGITLLHSGTLYPSPDRDPSTLFAAVAKLRELGKVTSAVLRIVLRGSGYYDYYREMIRRFDLQDIVFLKPAIPYRDALAEMLAADGLLLLQGHDSNPAIPAKVYEYFRAGRPIFAIVDLEGDTARLLKTEQVGMVVPMNTGEIAEKLALFIDQVSRNTGQHRRVTTVREFSRQARTRDLAVVIDDVASHVAGSKPTESR